jgi:tripartite-type tricarboxylate transporter receptor subunit TctC
MASAMIRIAAGMALSAVLATAALAQDYPTHPVKIVVGFPPGGGVDLVGRIMAAGLTKTLQQPVVVENKPGAAGTIGAAQVAKADPDGYTLLVTPGGHSLFGAVFASLPFHTVDSFAWISNVINVPFFAVVRRDSKFQSMADVITAAKAAPDKVSFGSAGPGSTHHLLGEMLGMQTGAKFLHVPYRGDAPVIAAVLAGEVDFAFATPTQVIANVAAGKFRALATTWSVRAPKLADVPTMREALGLEDFKVRTWFAMAGPAGLPPRIVARLNQEVRGAVTSPEAVKALEAIGGELQATTPDELRTRVADEFTMWTKVVDDAKIAKQ